MIYCEVCGKEIRVGNVCSMACQMELEELMKDEEKIQFEKINKPKKLEK